MGIVRAPLLLNEPTAQVIDGSLTFNGTNQYLSKNFASSGNRKTWTWSAWVKRHKFGASNYGLFGYDPGGNGSFIRFSDDSGGDTLRWFSDYNSRSVVSSAQFRDPGAWYHIIIALDTTLATQSDRVKRYINGVRQFANASAAMPNQDENQDLNQSGNHSLGRIQASNYGPVSMSNVYFIDGLALGPGYFGFTDPLTNTWRPKRFRAEGTTVNDGRTWSNNSTGTFDSGYPKTNAFNGNADNGTYAASGTTASFTFSNIKITQTNRLRVYGNSGFSNEHSITSGGVSKTWNNETLGWHDLTDLFPTPWSFDQYTVTYNGSLRAIEFGGIILRDGVTQNLDFGTNGFYLPMDNQDDFEKDKSGNGNDWTKNNFSGTSIDPDVVKDSPSGAVFGGRGQTGITTTSSAPANYCTFNPLDSNQTHSNGNLTVVCNGSTSPRAGTGTIVVSSGKYYWEVTVSAASIQKGIIGVVEDKYDGNGSTIPNSNGNSVFYFGEAGQKLIDGSSSSYGASYTVNDVIGVALNLDDGDITFYKNGSSQGKITTKTFTGAYKLATGHGSSSGSTTYALNTGQKPFKYAPPQGYLPLNSATARPNIVVPRPDQYVGVTTGNFDQQKTHVTGFQPDLIWHKSRAVTGSHFLTDSVRGKNSYLKSNDTSAAGTFPTSGGQYGITSFNSNGWTQGSYGPMSESVMVAWTWKAGGNKNTFNVDDIGYASAAAAGLDGGTITPVGASVGTKQGFSIVKFQGTGATATFSHGLEQAPDFMVCKADASGPDWGIYHRTLGSNKVMYFTTAAAATSTTAWDDTHPTDSLVYLGANGTTNQGGADSPMIYYIWHNVPGLQKFGSYVGNGSADGPFVELGFRPAVLIWKKSSASGGNWNIEDNGRSPFNPVTVTLRPNTTEADLTTSQGNIVELLSNGFKVRNTSDQHNSSGVSYIYCAWAEAPAYNLFGGQSNAR